MIFYGTNSSNLKTGKLRNVTCPNCGTDSSMDYTIFGKYAHIYWIPFFPTGRTNIVECNNCKATYDIKNLDEIIKNKFKQEQDRNPTKTPIKHFAMSFIIGFLILGFVLVGIKSDNDSEEFAKNPKVGDVFYETTSSGNYSTSKIVKVTKDSVFVMQNNMETDKKSSVDEIAGKEENYTSPFKYSKKQVMEAAKTDKEIYEIQRE
jgi:hypothetical protein